MFNLIKLEARKFKIRDNIKSALIADAVIFGLLCLIVFISYTEGEVDFMTYENVFHFMNTLINITFVVFAGFLIAKYIIGEYKNKTINVLFTYPINRKKIILSKLLLISLFTFSAIVLSSVLIFSIFYITQIVHPVILDSLTLDFLLGKFCGIIISGALNSIVSLIPVYIGFRKKSAPASIVTSLLIVSVISSDINGFSLSSFIIVPIIFAVLGAIMVYLTIRDIDNKDVVI